MNIRTTLRCNICGRLIKKDNSHQCPKKDWNKEFLISLKSKTEQCNVCGRLKSKTNKHTCSKDPWNKGKIGLQVSHNKGKKLSIETKQKISETRKERYKKGVMPDISGKRNPMYGKIPWNKKNGLLRNQIRHLCEYVNWRTLVFNRDKFTCQECFKKGSSDLVAHHIKTFFNILKDNKIDSLDKARSCGELWNIDNGITLCYTCHMNFHFHIK
jgi:hypothetical protein